ncbi:MAG: hypothetical protein K6G16_04635 [Lachnospiraceae bacterium]|nr:hypothetical protein [Lachnospiraceae bacterium]
MISVTEIILIIAGFVIVVLGYVLPAGKGDAHVDPEEVAELVQDRLDQSLNDSVRRQIDGMARDAVSDAIDDNKLDLSRISNEKVMEISEYAGTVMDDIKKNHDEVVFMYDMLNDKHKNLTSTVSEMTRTAENAKQTVRDAELTARDARDAAATLDAVTARAKAAQAEQRMEKARQESVTKPATPAAEETVPDPATAVQTDEHDADGDRFSSIFPDLPHVSEDQEAAVIAETAQAGNAGQTESGESGTNAGTEQGVRTANTPNTVKPAVKRAGAGEPMSQNRQILEMHNAGKSNMVIARELGLGIGEVRLVIDLSKKQNK